ncbi:MAG: hypothetical protein GY795_32365 [Desulfobacterales bacterium]|nr:hypothetical protein [Desulfobacterales bacterium]
MKFWHSLPCVLPKFHFGTPSSVSRKMKDAAFLYAQSLISNLNYLTTKIKFLENSKWRACLSLNIFSIQGAYSVERDFVKALNHLLCDTHPASVPEIPEPLSCSLAGGTAANLKYR